MKKFIGVSVLCSILSVMAHAFPAIAAISSASAQIVTDSRFPLFPTAPMAQQHFPFDVVVWVDTKTDTYSLQEPPKSANPDPNKVEGAYMCQHDADQMNYPLSQGH